MHSELGMPPTVPVFLVGKESRSAKEPRQRKFPCTVASLEAHLVARWCLEVRLLSLRLVRVFLFSSRFFDSPLSKLQKSPIPLHPSQFFLEYCISEFFAASHLPLSVFQPVVALSLLNWSQCWQNVALRAVAASWGLQTFSVVALATTSFYNAPGEHWAVSTRLRRKIAGAQVHIISSSSRGRQ